MNCSLATADALTTAVTTHVAIATTVSAHATIADANLAEAHTTGTPASPNSSFFAAIGNPKETKMAERQRWTFTINGDNYQHYQPTKTNIITFKCKAQLCNGCFKFIYYNKIPTLVVVSEHSGECKGIMAVNHVLERFKNILNNSENVCRCKLSMDNSYRLHDLKTSLGKITYWFR